MGIHTFKVNATVFFAAMIFSFALVFITFFFFRHTGLWVMFGQLGMAFTVLYLIFSK